MVQHKTRVPTQKVRKNRSDRCIALKCFHECSEAIFHGVAWNLYPPTASGRGHSNDRNGVQAQKVRIYRSDRWIVINFFHEFPEAVVHGVAWNPYPPRTSGRSHSNDRNRVQAQTSVSIDLTVGSRSKFFTSFRRLFSMELRGIRTTHRQRAVGGIPMTGMEYRLKRSVSIDPTVGSRSNFFTSFRRLFSIGLLGIRSCC